jgi:hypothetical protein
MSVATAMAMASIASSQSVSLTDANASRGLTRERDWGAPPSEATPPVSLPFSIRPDNLAGAPVRDGFYGRWRNEPALRQRLSPGIAWFSDECRLLLLRATFI